jgi:ribosomal protein L29
VTIDERLERLTDRHEALAQSVELLNHSIQEQRRNIDRILTVVEAQTSNIEALFTVVGNLTRVAENHERPLERIEERPS